MKIVKFEEVPISEAHFSLQLVTRNWSPCIKIICHPQKFKIIYIFANLQDLFQHLYKKYFNYHACPLKFEILKLLRG